VWLVPYLLNGSNLPQKALRVKTITIGYIPVSILLFTCSSPAKADWVNLTGAQSAPNIAEIHIEDDHVRLVLEIYIDNVATFVSLLPDEFFSDRAIEVPPFEERIHRFSSEDFQFIAQDGKKLQAGLKLIEPRLRKDRPNPFAGMINPYTGQPIPGPPQDKRVLYAELGC
jgi:hypothetical protein